METRRIAGHIIPAMITTTSMVSSLSCIEMVKLVQNVPMYIHRNAFINLSIPFLGFTAPLPAVKRQGLYRQKYTLWDRIIIKESRNDSLRGGITLRQFIKTIKKNSLGEDGNRYDVSSVYFDKFLLYANFLHENDNLFSKTSIWKLVKDALCSEDNEVSNNKHSSIEMIDKRTFIELSVLIEPVVSDTCREVELPPVRLLRWLKEYN